MLKKRTLFAILLIFNLEIINSKADEIRVIAVVNEEIITSYDLYKEVKLIESLENRIVNNKEKINIINKIINNRIKYLTTKDKNIKLDEKDINQKVDKIIKNSKLDDDKEVKDLIFEKVRIETKWNKLILLKFRNKLEVNMNEIEEKITSKKTKMSKDQIINIEKMNKAAILSKTYFNEIKQKFFIKII
jgi:hypothetical protein